MRSFLFFIFGSTLIFGCGIDEPEGTIGHIFTDPNKVYFQGDELILEATFKNNLGLKRIEIVNSKLDIDFEKDLEGQIVYNLYLERRVPILQVPEIHELLITMTDIKDEVKYFSYEVDYVFIPKILDLRFYIDREDDGINYLRGRLEDPHGIKSIEMYSLDHGNLINRQFTEGVYSFDLNEDFWYPPHLTLGESPIYLKITNQRDFILTISNFEGILGD